MIIWKRADPLPDGPDDSRVIDAHYGWTDSGERIYLTHQVYMDAQRGEFATLGVLGRLPTEEDIRQANEKLGPEWEEADWKPAGPGISLLAAKPI